MLLYELLAGCLPFAPNEFSRDELLQKHRDEKPLCPSARFKSLVDGELLNIAHCRQVVPSVLFNALNGDLDSIVMKCLEKTPYQRYETADGLATDIQRYLRGEKLLEAAPAKPKSKIHVGAVIAGLIGLTMLIGAIMYVYGRGRKPDFRPSDDNSTSRRIIDGAISNLDNK